MMMMMMITVMVQCTPTLNRMGMMMQMKHIVLAALMMLLMFVGAEEAGSCQKVKPIKLQVDVC